MAKKIKNETPVIEEAVLDEAVIVNEQNAGMSKKERRKREKALKPFSLEKRNARAGYKFISPWLVGAVFLFIVPLFQAAQYVFNKIDIGDSGLILTPIGFENFRKLFIEDNSFIRSVVESLGNMVLEVPIIIFFSLFVGLVLRQKFFGRTAARALFFLPVIIASGVVITILKTQVLMESGATGSEDVNIFSTGGLEALLASLGITETLAADLLRVIRNIFDLTWKSGVQILLLMAALNSIPSSQYEVASIEGATEWEKFWKITMPLVSPTILVTIVYTIIDNFTSYNNGVMWSIQARISKGEFSVATTMSLVYFIGVLFVIGVVFFVVNKFVFYENE